MTSEQVVKFFGARPFKPFTCSLVNGRELQVLHPEQVSVGRHALVVSHIHPSRQLEVIDAAHIVSLRTIYPADIDSWSEDNDAT